MSNNVYKNGHVPKTRADHFKNFIIIILVVKKNYPILLYLHSDFYCLSNLVKNCILGRHTLQSKNNKKENN